MKTVIAVLSKDISQRKYPTGIETVKVFAGNTYELPFGTKVETLLSTDSGVAFLLTCAEGVIYHAGDLNDWVWTGETEEYNRQMTGNFRHEIQKIKGRNIDIAFVPLDPRQEEHYADGIKYFLQNVNIKKVYPMHYWEKPQIIEKFLSEYPEYGDIIEKTEAC